MNTGLPEDPDVNILVINPQSPQIVYAGIWGGGVYKSTNGGANWTEMNTGLGNTYVDALAIDPENPEILYAGTTKGVYKSTNGGANWIAINSGLLNLTRVTSLAIDYKTPDIIYLGSENAGVSKSTDGGGKLERNEYGAEQHLCHGPGDKSEESG